MKNQESDKMNVSLLKVPERDVVYEDHEDEMIFLHLKKGFYYTLNRAGADCVIALLCSESIEHALSWLQKRFISDRESLLAYCEKLIAELIRENLVIKRENGVMDAVSLDDCPDALHELTPYHLEKYEDIQDILKFDPVHEVGEDGWPSVIDK